MKLVLQPSESIKQRRAKERLAVDADLVHSTIRTNPGIAGKSAIAAKTGLSPERVASVIKRINAGETGQMRVEYGEVRVHGEVLRGWYAMDRKRHHDAMDQADEHSALTEVGVRRSRLIRFAQAQGIRGAEAVVERIEERLGLSIEAMTQDDLDAFEDLLIEAADGEAA